MVSFITRNYPTKSDSDVCATRGFRSDRASVQSDQSLRCRHGGSLDVWLSLSTSKDCRQTEFICFTVKGIVVVGDFSQRGAPVVHCLLISRFRVRAPPEAKIFFNRNRGSIAHSFLLSPAHRPEIIETVEKNVK